MGDRAWGSPLAGLFVRSAKRRGAAIASGRCKARNPMIHSVTCAAVVTRRSQGRNCDRRAVRPDPVFAPANGLAACCRCSR